MNPLIRGLVFIVVPLSCALSEPAPTPQVGLADRDQLFPKIEKLKSGDAIDSIIEEFGKPFTDDKKGEISRLSYLYWPIPQKAQSNGKYPKGVILILVKDKLDKWFEWFGDGPN